MNRKAFALALVAAGMIATAVPSHAYRMIQNTGVGRFSAGAAVACNATGGFTHWNNKNITWRLNTANQGSGKSTALSNALASWTNVTSADHVLTYGGTTTTGWSTNGTNTVLWASAGRSGSTQARAQRANLQDAGTVAELVKASEIVLSVCPPHLAEEVASEVAHLGFTGVYVEGNAISPDRTRAIQRIVEDAGAHYVDGGIIGGPAWTREAKTHMYLSGPRAQEVAACFAGSPLQTPVISERIGAASALKMLPN